MPETSPAYLWYPKDVLSSGKVSELSAAEECWYRRALDHSWLDEGIPADPVKAARRIGKGCTTKAAAMLLEMFFIPDAKHDGTMLNEKQEKLRKELRQKSAKRKEAGRLSGVKRRETRDLNTEQCSNNEEAKTNIAIASSIPIPKKKKSTTTTAAMTDDEWLDSLAENLAYLGLGVRTEYAKAKLWADTNGRQCSRRFFINWLNRARPITTVSVKNGSKPISPDVPANDDPVWKTEPDPPCPYCGKEICWTDHRADMRIQ